MITEHTPAFANNEQSGITLRQYYAGLAMQGSLANPNPSSIDDCVKDAVQAADALINELNKQP